LPTEDRSRTDLQRACELLTRHVQLVAQPPDGLAGQRASPPARRQRDAGAARGLEAGQTALETGHEQALRVELPSQRADLPLHAGQRPHGASDLLTAETSHFGAQSGGEGGPLQQTPLTMRASVERVGGW